MKGNFSKNVELTVSIMEFSLQTQVPCGGCFAGSLTLYDGF